MIMGKLLLDFRDADDELREEQIKKNIKRGQTTRKNLAKAKKDLANQKKKDRTSKMSRFGIDNKKRKNLSKAKKNLQIAKEKSEYHKWDSKRKK